MRFAINPAQVRANTQEPGRNGFGGVPPVRGLGRHYSVEVTCRGELDRATGYLVNIKDIDQAVRAAIIPRITDACDRGPEVEPGELLPSLLAPLDDMLRGRVSALRWGLSPYYSVAMNKAEPGVVLVRQRFEFAASHRLHVPTLSDAQNRALFGKCNHPGGHGHNYVVEPTVAVRLDATGHQPLTLETLERVVDAVIIQPFDHKHLSVDVPQFRNEPQAAGGGAGVNASVENIARVCYESLAPALKHECPAADLRSITVWETDRTSSTYPG